MLLIIFKYIYLFFLSLFSLLYSGLFFLFFKLLLFIDILLQYFLLISSFFYLFLKFNFNKDFNKDKKNKNNKLDFSY